MDLERRLAADSDPRVDERYIECIRSDSDVGTLLVGVVHDHPSSSARVRRVVDIADPTYVALESPPLAIPYYVQCAKRRRPIVVNDDGTARPSARVSPGGEMVAAVGAADDATPVGIDGPTLRFCGEMAVDALGGRFDWQTGRAMLSTVGSITRQALSCRLAGTVMRHTTMQVTAKPAVEYDCPVDPGGQAAHEAETVERTSNFLRSVDEPDGMRLLNERRERHMAANIDRLQDDGTVVAVVGQHHLEPLAERLRLTET